MANNLHFEISTQTHMSNHAMNSPHTHSHFEFFYLYDGECDFLIGDTIYNLKPGSAIMVNKGVPHQTSYVNADYHKRLCIEFSQDYCTEIFSAFSESWLNSAFFNNAYMLNEESRALVNDFASFIYVEKGKADFVSDSLIKMFLQTILFATIRNRNSIISKAIKNSEIHDLDIYSAIAYINKNFQHPISLNDIASAVHLNPAYLSTKFKNVVGTGYKEYLISLRISHAERQLLETKKSISEIATESGFSNSNYFGDAFFRVHNVSPSKFRALKGYVLDKKDEQ